MALQQDGCKRSALLLPPRGAAEWNRRRHIYSGICTPYCIKWILGLAQILLEFINEEKVTRNINCFEMKKNTEFAIFLPVWFSIREIEGNQKIKHIIGTVSQVGVYSFREPFKHGNPKYKAVHCTLCTVQSVIKRRKSRKANIFLKTCATNALSNKIIARPTIPLEKESTISLSFKA